MTNHCPGRDFCNFMRFAVLVALAWSMLRCAAAPESDAWCETHRCEWTDLALDPQEGYASVVGGALARLDKATGNGFASDPYGIPVFFQPTVEYEGKIDCGHTVITRIGDRILSIEIYIATAPPAGCMPVEAVIMHEAIHAFAVGSRHVDAGLFASGGSHDGLLNGASLDVLCEHVGCWQRKDER